MAIRSKPQSNKQNGLPAGVSCTWRQYPEGERSPYLEYQVVYKERNQTRIKHFYVGVSPTKKREREIRALAIAFRQDYEERVTRPAPTRKKRQ
jgi:hypothetical protein